MNVMPKRKKTSAAIKSAILEKIKERSIDNKIKGFELGKPWGLQSEAIRSQVINPFRCVPHTFEIASTSEGYWWATDPIHIKLTIDHLTSRIRGMVNAIGGLKIAMARLELEKQGIYQDSLQGKML